MDIFLLRHGHAVSEAPKDSLRPLSALGISQVKTMMQRYHAELEELDALVVSPYLRAQQTADVVVEELAGYYPSKILPKIETELLVPSGAPEKMIAWLAPLVQEKNLQSVLLVGHLPLIGVLFDDLCGVEPGRYRFATASLAKMETEVIAKACCRMRWLHHVD